MAIAAVALAASVYSSYLNKRAGDKAQRAQEDAANRVFDYAGQLRKDSMRALSDRKVYGASEWLFPGLLAPPQTFTNAHGEQKSVFGGDAGVDKGSVAANPWGYMNKAPAAASTLSGRGRHATALGTGVPTPGGALPSAGPLPPTSGGAHAGVDPAAFDPARASTDTPGGPNPTYLNQPTVAPPTGGAMPMASGGLNSGPLHAGVDPASKDKSGASVDAGAFVPSIGGGFGGFAVGNVVPAPAPKPRRKRKVATPDSPTMSTGVGGVSTNPNDYAGALVTRRMMEFLKNPGQLSSITYERAQEQANQGFNMASQDAMARVMGVGLDPRSGIGQTIQENNVLNLSKARNEAARDYSLAQDQMRRADIGMGTEMYQNALQTVFGLQGARSQAAQAGGVPNPGAPTAAGAGTASLGSSVGGVGSALSGLSGSSGASSGPQAQTTGMNGQPVQGTITYLPGQGK